jgi:hypothetical protein
VMALVPASVSGWNFMADNFRFPPATPVCALRKDGRRP